MTDKTRDMNFEIYRNDSLPEPEVGQIWLWKDQEDRQMEVLILGMNNQYAKCWRESTGNIYNLRVDWLYKFTGQTINLDALKNRSGDES